MGGPNLFGKGGGKTPAPSQCLGSIVTAYDSWVTCCFHIREKSTISKKHCGEGGSKTPALSQSLGIVMGCDTFAAIGIWCFHSLGIVGIQSDCCDTVALEGLEIKEVAGDGFIVAHGYVKSSW